MSPNDGTRESRTPSPPVIRGDLPAERVRGVYKVELEDFIVDELALYEPDGEGEHVWIRVEKRGIGTMPLVERLAEAFGKRARELGYAGLKDARAIARQWISIPGIDEERARALELPGVRVLDVRRHGNKLKLGHLRGNRFDVIVRGVGAEHRDAVAANLAFLAARGVPNSFGMQRFGQGGANLDKGLAILRGNPGRATRRLPKRLLRLLVSAVQSEVFNRVVARRVETLDRLVPGDVAYLHANGACFAVGEPRDEQPRCDAFEISPSGPLPGPKLLRTTAEAAAIEAAALDEVGVDCELFARAPGRANQGARRPLRARLRAPEVEPVDPGLRVRFELERGSFATAVLDQLFVPG